MAYFCIESKTNAMSKGGIIEFTAYRVVFPGHTCIGIEFGESKNSVTYDIQSFDRANNGNLINQFACLSGNEKIKVRGRIVAASTLNITVELLESNAMVDVWHDGNYEGIKFIDDEE